MRKNMCETPPPCGSRLLHGQAWRPAHGPAELRARTGPTWIKGCGAAPADTRRPRRPPGRPAVRGDRWPGFSRAVLSCNYFLIRLHQAAHVFTLVCCFPVLWSLSELSTISTLSGSQVFNQPEKINESITEKVSLPL